MTSRKKKAESNKQSPAQSKPKIAVFGDAWHSTMVLYARTAETDKPKHAGNGLPTFSETSFDFAFEDGVETACKILRNIVDHRHAADGNKQTPEPPTPEPNDNNSDTTADSHIKKVGKHYQPLLNRLITVQSYTSESDRDKEVPDTRRVSSIKYLKNEKTDDAHRIKCDTQPKDATYNAAVIIDDGGKWRTSNGIVNEAQGNNGAAESTQTLGDLCPEDDSPVFVVLGTGLPEDTDKDEHGATVPTRFKDEAWHRLSSDRKNVNVVLSASLLRLGGIHISRRLSWDQTIEDLCYEILDNPRLRLMHQKANLIVRFGMSAVALIKKNTDEGAALVFMPQLPDPAQRNLEADGQTIGKGTVLTAGILRMMLDGPKLSKQVSIKGIKLGLELMAKRFQEGYLRGFPIQNQWDAKKWRDQEETTNELFGNDIYKIIGSWDESKCKFATCKLPTSHWGEKRPFWTILGESIPRQRESGKINRLNLAEAIVFAGTKKVLNDKIPKDNVAGILTRTNFDNVNEDIFHGEDVPSEHKCTVSTTAGEPADPPSIDVPILTIGKYSSIDRKEIECIRAVRNLMTGYIANFSLKTPLSIALFGRPGSGKSFAVKQIAKEMRERFRSASGSSPVEILSYNLSQFKSSEELTDIFDAIRDENIRGVTPIVFIDEFDSNFDDQACGWLKYWLAPMQDGEYKTKTHVIDTGRAILVFAGGTAHSFEDFARGNAPVKPGMPMAPGPSKEFVAVKGPDFVSRLKGFIDVASINPVPKARSSTLKINDNPKPVLRRAILLRSMLEANDLVWRDSQNVKRALIDETIVFAMLTISKYEHEARSMEAIIRMCSPLQGRITKASLPHKSQLDMHISAAEFYERMRRAQKRDPAWPSE